MTITKPVDWDDKVKRAKARANQAMLRSLAWAAFSTFVGAMSWRFLLDWDLSRIWDFGRIYFIVSFVVAQLILIQRTMKEKVKVKINGT